MNAAVKNDILTSYRAGTTDFEKLAKHYGCTPAQAEKIVFPHGRFKKVLPFIVPKVSKTIVLGTFNGETVRVAEVHALKRKLETPVVTAKIEARPPATTTTKSTAKSPTGRLGALKAWETMREQKALKNGEIYIRRTDEELKRLAGLTDDRQEPEDPIVKVKPEAVKARIEQLETEGRKQEAEKIRNRLHRHKDEELYVDSARIVEAGRAVVAYCDHKNITPEQLIEAYEQLVAINKLLGK